MLETIGIYIIGTICFVGAAYTLYVLGYKAFIWIKGLFKKK
jgi:hypothetical protein